MLKILLTSPHVIQVLNPHLQTFTQVLTIYGSLAPTTNGIASVQSIQKEQHAAHLPLVVLTSSGLDPLFQSYLRLT